MSLYDSKGLFYSILLYSILFYKNDGSRDSFIQQLIEKHQNEILKGTKVVRILFGTINMTIKSSRSRKYDCT